MRRVLELLRLVLKFPVFVLTVLAFILTVLPIYPLYLINSQRIRPWLSWIVSFYCRFAWGIFALEVDHGGQGDPLNGWEEEKYGGRLIVSNHLSYLDIFALAAQRPTCFVTSVEIKETPVLGQLCQLGGCLFVERRSREHLSREVREIYEALANGENVCVFPEGTSTNGEKVRRFKRPLFCAALDAGAIIQPVTLNYLSVSGEKLAINNRDHVFWYGDMDFLPHLVDVFSQSRVHVYTTWHRAFREDNCASVSEVAERSQRIVASSYINIEKRGKEKKEATWKNSTSSLTHT
mgnify:CR=1 FL=1